MALVSDAAQSNGDVIRRLDDLERALREESAARRLESAVIGSGGIKVRGGEIVIQTADGLTDLAVLASSGIFFNGQPLLFPGSVSWFAGPSGSVPLGWLICNGTAVSRTTYAALFAIIGTTWGVGDGSTTFNLPDLRDRVPVGAGSTYSVGATGGATTHTHTQGNTGGEAGHTHTQGNTGTTGSHSHGLPGSSQGTATGGSNVASDTHGHGSDGSHAHTNPTTSAGSSHAHTNPTTDSGSNLPPYGALIPIIRT